MSNETPAPEGAKNRAVGAHDEEIADEKTRAVVVDKSDGDTQHPPLPLVEPVRGTSHVSETPTDVAAQTNGDAPVTAPAEPVARTEQDPQPRPATSAASMQTVYVPAPVPPSKKGNRGFGVLIALISTVVFAGLYALVIATIRAVEVGVFQFDFFGSLAFYTPAIFFFVGFVIVVVLANRASWWSYVLGSLFVGLFVYFGTVGTGLLVNNVLGETPPAAAQLLSSALSSPFIIGAALLAREVSMWMGAIISARGRKVKARNIDVRETFDRESAARTAEYENSRYGTPAGTA
ncbi:MAG: hypothetical protein H7201_14415 [Candidatus Saccharibacteria bacterium]|nr:hypothetical protein [Microbacteriaceae bacterium]